MPSARVADDAESFTLSPTYPLVGRSISVIAFDHVPLAAFLSTSIATRSCASFSPPDAV
ncbi:hypothetical protein SMICM304S_12224 [Streptomyces microflavus]